MCPTEAHGRLEHFFHRATWIALRELALRRTADDQLNFVGLF